MADVSPVTASGSRSSGSAKFVGHGSTADVAVVIVTYNNAADIGPLIESLRQEAAGCFLRVIVADNDSIDGTLDRVALHGDVIAFPTGGNLGYAAGINAAHAHIGDAQSVLVLNPDVVVEAGAIRAMLDRITHSAAGVVVPRIVDASGTLYESLRFEPTLLRAIGDALFGSRYRTRPGWLSEIDFDEEHYAVPHPVEWATGAALLVRRDVTDRLGAWDERFFLYSEEVDYFRRVREAGETVWYEPKAAVRHSQGGSGTSAAFTALMAVNRVRYIEKNHMGLYAFVYRLATILHALLRSSQRGHRDALAYLTNRNAWRLLPHATGGEK